MGDMISILIFSLTQLGALPNYTTNDFIKDIKETYHEYRPNTIQSSRSATDYSRIADCLDDCPSGNAFSLEKDSYKTQSRSGDCDSLK